MDRKSYFYIIKITGFTSLSARRAWIEKAVTSEVSEREPVALRKESVDRKIDNVHSLQYDVEVALRKESVDRKKIVWSHLYFTSRRSPQGERG